MAQDQNPTIRLIHALNALDCVFSNTDSFRQLVEQRAAHAESDLKIQNLAASVWTNERRDAGASPIEVMKSTADKLSELESISIPSSENPGSIESLQSVLADGTKAVEWALDALRMGGGDVLDTALNPSASNQTIRLRTKLGEAQSLFRTMEPTLAMPNVLLDSSVEKMGDLASWFRQVSRELAAVVEQHGCDGKSTETQNTDKLRPARWFTTATKGAISGDTLRKAVKRGALVQSAQSKPGKEWWHSIEEVCEVYHQHAPKIRDAFTRERP